MLLPRRLRDPLRESSPAVHCERHQSVVIDSDGVRREGSNASVRAFVRAGSVGKGHRGRRREYGEKQHALDHDRPPLWRPRAQEKCPQHSVDLRELMTKCGGGLREFVSAARQIQVGVDEQAADAIAKIAVNKERDRAFMGGYSMHVFVAFALLCARGSCLMRALSALASVALLTVAAAPLAAHHSFAAEYDANK